MFDITSPIVFDLGLAQIAEGAASLSAESSLVAAGLIAGLTVSLSAESDLVATAGQVVIAPAISMSAQSNMTVDTIPTYRLVLPIKEYAYTENVLLKRYPVNSGVSLLLTGTTGVFGEFVSQNEIKEADYYFGGGRQHQLNQVEYDAVVDAGFDDLVEVA